MANNIRLPLPMRFDGIVRIGDKIEVEGVEESILQFYKTKIWVNRGNLAGIDLSVAVRKYDQRLESGAYHRLNGSIIIQENIRQITFLPEGDNTINVGTTFIRPSTLANKISVNSCGVIIQLIHHKEESVVLQNIVLTALHRGLNPSTGRVEEFFTDYTIDAVMLLSRFPEMFTVGRLFKIKKSVYRESNGCHYGAFVTCRTRYWNFFDPFLLEHRVTTPD
ncbi:hypothetical protein DFH28DRAFT_938885 [Melampsora americana]|nr:hypothetical protein DFH28DRAFT_938885 [Melampsora americana]